MEVKITVNDIMMALGYKDTSANEFVLEQAALTAQSANEICAPSMLDRKIAIEKIAGDDVILETGDVFTCKSLAKEIAGCSHVIVSLYTIGKKMDEEIANAFNSGDPLSGMMTDAAGSRLVSYYANQTWKKYTKELPENMGITRGFAPGSQDFPIEQQAVVFNLIDAEKIGVSLNESMLMKPAKSISAVYGIGENINDGCAAHSCAKCPRKDCMMRDDRQIVIRIHNGEKSREITTPIGKNLREVFIENDVHMEFPCNGKKTCGGCAVRFVKTVPEITEHDKKSLSQPKLNDGWRLACKVEVSHPLELYIEDSPMQILSEQNSGDTEVDNYSIAIDIGTTTVVCHLVDADDGNILDTEAEVNAQRKYGADVASRILHEMEHEDGKKHLNDAIINQLNRMIDRLLIRNDYPKIKEVIAVGNTIMTHILLGYDITALGQAPYTPVSLDRATVSCASLGINLNSDIIVIEGMDSYVGADISVGAAYCNLMENEKYTLLIDLGTNGEIALGNKETLLCCATAAGPAFEAVNIHNGMSALPGAVSEFYYEDGKYKHKTLGGSKALGICGSGVLDITSVLVARGVVDITGRLLKNDENVEYNETLKEHFVVARGRDEDVVFTAKDVREIQLAKAAIAAGVKTLIETAEISYEDIKKVYIAGGFGNYMRIESALELGLIPKELKDRIAAAGNTAAKGAVACHNMEFLDKVERYVKSSKHIELATSMIFQNHYIESMGFDG